ncbi:hypothetical protein AZH53_04400 [Methanomicrobiaceae archaeon CYW5]|uniref:hypothetical protein n=1 Tax=Methanovulcanius yangii TaxID=1789227 RepID=UPI0029C9BAD7|nr:hypothetical protein [Methanovulcanius yangii]MBT8507659.1 hypothetical protein [Methanovulcanius yangii]
MKRRSFDGIAGESTEEKFGSLGIVPGEKEDIRELRSLSKSYGFEAVLYFEKDLAETSTYEADLTTYADDPEDCRPFVLVTSFIKFASESDPSFLGRLEEFPLYVTVLSVGEREVGGKKLPYVKCLMPFLDEIDFDKEPEGTYLS